MSKVMQVLLSSENLRIFDFLARAMLLLSFVERGVDGYNVSLARLAGICKEIYTGSNLSFSCVYARRSVQSIESQIREGSAQLRQAFTCFLLKLKTRQSAIFQSLPCGTETAMPHLCREFPSLEFCLFLRHAHSLHNALGSNCNKSIQKLVSETCFET